MCQTCSPDVCWWNVPGVKQRKCSISLPKQDYTLGKGNVHCLAPQAALHEAGAPASARLHVLLQASPKAPGYRVQFACSGRVKPQIRLISRLAVPATRLFSVGAQSTSLMLLGASRAFAPAPVRPCPPQQSRLARARPTAPHRKRVNRPTAAAAVGQAHCSAVLN